AIQLRLVRGSRHQRVEAGLRRRLQPSPQTGGERSLRLGADPRTGFAASAEADLGSSGDSRAAVTATVVPHTPRCAMSACTSNIRLPHSTRCAWLLPGPKSIAPAEPAFSAI